MWRRLVMLGSVGVLAAGALTAPSVAADDDDDTWIGTGEVTCAPGPRADCRDVVYKWKFDFNGDLRGAKFARAKLQGADLRGANLDEANFRGAVLREADLRGVSAVEADFSPAAVQDRTSRSRPCRLCHVTDLRGAYRMFAHLPRANFAGADLSGAHLSGGILFGANLSGANLSGANLYDVYLTGANLSGSITDSRTSCPNGNNGPCW